MKVFLTGFILFVSTNTFAGSFLEDLPFNIQIGVTTNKEIENRGVCQSQIKVSENYFRCESYSMAGGKFNVSSSSNEIISSVTFSVGNVLPKAWQQNGISLTNKNACDIWGDSQLQQRMAAEEGITAEKFHDLVNKLGAQNITFELIDRYEFFVKIKISFDLGNYYYSATFSFLPEYHNLPAKDLGLDSITITENY